MKINQFEDIESWKIARILATDIYTMCEKFRDFGFRDQITRAVISISNNIAEGYERQGNKEFRKFLYIAKGSAAEVRSMLYIAKDLGYCTDEEFSKFQSQITTISKLLSGFISYLSSQQQD